MFLHLLTESAYTYKYNKLLNDHFDIGEHHFLVFGKSTWDINENYQFKNSTNVKLLKKKQLLEILSQSSGIIIHGLFSHVIINLFYKNQHLLSKSNWLIWGGDLYLYREIENGIISKELEYKRKTIIRKLGFISCEVEGDFILSQKVYATKAKYFWAGYPFLLDFDYLKQLKEIKHVKSETRILLGNSATKTNNHIEAFDSIKKYKDQNIKIYTPLSYGNEEYAKKIIDYGKSIFGAKFIPLNDFIPFQKFMELVASIDVGIMNHDRQQALGSIFSLLFLDKKIFMRNNITTSDYLKNVGLKTFNINEINSLKFDDFIRFEEVDQDNEEKILGMHLIDNWVKKWQNVFNSMKENEVSDDSKQVSSTIIMSKSPFRTQKNDLDNIERTFLKKTERYFELDNRLITKEWTNKKNLYIDSFEYFAELKEVENPTVSLIIIAWKFKPEILENLKVLEKQQENNFELIFVNNGADENVFNVLDSYIHKYIKLNKNTGAYLARNLGALFANSDLLLFLDDDCLPDENLVISHIEAHEKYEIIACRGSIYPKTKYSFVPNHYHLGDKIFPMYADIEGNTSYKAELFFKVGGWDDQITFGGGGVDLAIRLTKLDPNPFKQIYSYKPLIYHDYERGRDHFIKKSEKQEKSRKRLKIIHKNWDEFRYSYKKYYGKSELVFSDNNDLDIILTEKTANQNIFSIIILDVNTIKSVQKTVDSIKNRLNKNIELIITNAQINIEIERSENFKNVKFISSENKTQAELLNSSILIAKGNYLVWVKSGDEFEPNLIDWANYEIQKNINIDILFSDVKINENENSNRLIERNEYYRNSDQFLIDILSGKKNDNSEVIIKRSFYDKIGLYSEELKYSTTFDFYLRAALNAQIKTLKCFIIKNNYVEPADKSIEECIEEISIIKELFGKTPPEELFHELDINKKTDRIILYIETAYIFSLRLEEDEALKYYLLAFPNLLSSNNCTNSEKMKLWQSISDLLKIIFKQNTTNYERHEYCINRILESNYSYKNENKNSFNELETKQNNKRAPIQDEVKISICIPTYNRAKFLRKTIESALDQDYNNYEIIILDDGSTDDTNMVVKPFMNNEKVKFVEKEHTNAPDTRNKLITHSTGNYILWLDSDDNLYPNVLSKYVEILAAYPKVNMVYGNIRFTDFSGNEYGISNYVDWYNNPKELKSKIISGQPFPNPFMLIKKSLYKEAGYYNVEFTRAHDYEFNTRLVTKANINMKLINEVIGNYIIHDDNLTTTKSGEIDTSFEIKILDSLLKLPLQTFFPNLDWLGKESESNSIAFAEIALQYKKYNSYDKTIQFYQKSLDAYPYNSATYYGLGEIALEMNKLEEAKNLFNQAANYSEMIDFAQGKIDALNEKLGIKSEEIDIYTLRGKQLLINEAEKAILEEDLMLAKNIINRILEINPIYIEALNNLVVIQIMENSVEEALMNITKIIEIDPKNSTALENLKYLEENITIS